MSRILDEKHNFLGVQNSTNWPETSGVVIIPVPYEQTASYGLGSGNGPAEILTASHHVELYDAELEFAPVEEADDIITLKPLSIDGYSGQSLAQYLDNEVASWLKTGKRVITLGGEHTSVVGAIKAHIDYYNDITILQFDAHSDLRSSYQKDAWNHACTMARVLDFYNNIVQVGIRSQSKSEKEKASRLGLPIFYANAIHKQERKGWDWISEIIHALSEKVYITFDCDVMDPSIMPATGAPEPGGLTWSQLDRLFGRICQECQIIGFDVSELSPVKALNYPQYTVAKLIYRLIGYMHMKQVES